MGDRHSTVRFDTSEPRTGPETLAALRHLLHPALGKLSVREMLFFTLYHNAHHLNLIASRVGTHGETQFPTPDPRIPSR